MRVDVAELRVQGRKRSREEVRATLPVRGDLQLTRAHGAWHRERVRLLAGLIVPGGTEWLLPPLESACVTRIQADELVVVGIQELERTRRSWLHYPQAWWCRLVHERPAAPTDEQSPRPVHERAGT